MQKITAFAGTAILAAGLVAACAVASKTPAAAPPSVAATAAQSAKSQPFVVAVRRLTESQYRNVIEDTFGPGLQLNARFEPERREDGLQAIGNSKLSITTSGFEQYFSLASAISTQLTAAKKRDEALGCQPASPTAADEACTRAVVQRVGAQLFRRPLAEDEVATRLKIAATGTAKSNDYYEGARMALQSLLVDPEFLFRVEVGEPDAARPGKYRLDANSKISRLSFLIWDSAPDADLRTAAASGAIHTDAGLKAQIARMTASPRAKSGARAFFTDMLQFENFDGLTKDGATYPKYSQKVADSAREQTLKTLLDIVVDQNRDYRDIFTSNETYVNRALAAVYKVPYRSKQEWMKYTFPDESERSGILTQVTFLSLFSHPAASSPTKRGVKINEIFKCQPTPDPPADVDFSKVQALDKGTVRTRLLDHMNNPGCSVCHRISDPVGLTLERFDGLGQRRDLENGVPIDVSAQISGAAITGAPGLGKALHNDPAIPACLVRNVYAYGVGKAPGDFDEDYLAGQTKAFAAAGYRFKDLVASIATSPEYFTVAPPKPKAPAQVKPSAGAAQ